jgi:hypothetical protein
MERAPAAVDRLANEDPVILEIFDKVQAVIGRADLKLKHRLLEVARLLAGS